MERLKKWLGLNTTNYKQLLNEGAIIVDVRTKGEYTGGNIAGSVNIPLDQLASNILKYKKDQTIITCCASGMRSASAKSMLKSMGYSAVYNGGGWSSLNQKLK